MPQAKKEQIRSWKDIARTFMEQYIHMLEMAPNRFTLQGMRKGPDENYKECATRWKEVAFQVESPLINREINSLFVDTLPSLYYDKLIGNAFSKNFKFTIILCRLN